MADAAAALAFLVGLAAIVAGVWMLSPAVSLIVGGILVVLATTAFVRGTTSVS